MSLLGRNQVAAAQILGSPPVAIIMILFIIASVLLGLFIVLDGRRGIATVFDTYLTATLIALMLLEIEKTVVEGGGAAGLGMVVDVVVGAGTIFGGGSESGLGSRGAVRRVQMGQSNNGLRQEEKRKEDGEGPGRRLAPAPSSRLFGHLIRSCASPLRSLRTRGRSVAFRDSNERSREPRRGASC